MELGAVTIGPFVCGRCVAQPKKDKSERLQRIADAAAGQSGRGILPKVLPAMSFEEMLKRAAENQRVLFFCPGGSSLAEAAKEAESLSLITGPEGGFTPEEVRQAQAAGCLPTGLGPRILRCETAPLAALAAVMALNGEL